MRVKFVQTYDQYLTPARIVAYKPGHLADLPKALAKVLIERGIARRALTSKPAPSTVSKED